MPAPSKAPSQGAGSRQHDEHSRAIAEKSAESLQQALSEIRKHALRSQYGHAKAVLSVNRQSVKESQSRGNAAQRQESLSASKENPSSVQSAFRQRAELRNNSSGVLCQRPLVPNLVQQKSGSSQVTAAKQFSETQHWPSQHTIL